MTPVYLGGVGLWSPGYANAHRWIERRPDPAVTSPPCEILSSRLRRFTSMVTRMAVEALAEAAGAAAADLTKVPTIWGSAHGEIRTAVELLEMIATEGLPAPARFKNSVHNTASGHVSIATGNGGFSTALAAEHGTIAMCLLEAITWLDERGGSVLVAVADEALPEPLCAAARYGALAVAFHLGTAPPATNGLARLANLRRDPAVAGEPLPDDLRASPCAAGLPLLEAALRRRTGPVTLDPRCLAGGWCVDVTALDPP